MFLIDVGTGERIEAFIERMEAIDFKRIERERNYQFDWNVYKKQEVYKLFINNNDILGLMCLLDHPAGGFNFLEVVTLEIHKEQRGSLKIYDRIAGSLLGFAARLSFQLGREGWLYLVAKTLTATIFIHKYGFEYIGSVGSFSPRLASDEKNSQRLIQEYCDRL